MGSAASNLGDVARVERREVFACPLPSGRFLLWGAAPSPGARTRQVLPDVYAPPLGAVPAPRWVDRQLYPSWAAVKAAAERHATVTVLAHPAVLRQWLVQVGRTVDRSTPDDRTAPAVFWSPGAVGFRCLHAHCRHRTWRDLAALPPSRFRSL
ncbi:MAG: hypothetical protein K6V97_05735 [Actinomycetia bacterium]|nr:hypothetical protein [Actinomycetes bacterium]